LQKRNAKGIILSGKKKREGGTGGYSSCHQDSKTRLHPITDGGEKKEEEDRGQAIEKGKIKQHNGVGEIEVSGNLRSFERV